MTNWFILAAGEATRCNGEIKQLFDINGEPLIHRTVRLIHEYAIDPQITIVTWRPEIARTDCRLLIARGGSLAATMLKTAPWWGDRNVLLCGDVVVTGKFIRTLDLHAGRTLSYGRFTDRKHSMPERYALTINGKDRERVINGMKRCVEHPLGNEVPCCITNWLGMKLGTLRNYDGPLGYLFWHHLIWFVAHQAPMFQIHDMRVRDIDTLDELVWYRSNHECYLSD